MFFLALLMGILWLFGSVGFASYISGKIVGGDTLTKGYDFWYFLLAPTFALLPPALVLIVHGY